MQTISWVLKIKNQPNSFRASAALTLNAFDAAMVDFKISVTDSRNHGARSYADDEIASQNVRLRYVLCRVRGQYGWRLALAGDNAHNQIAAPTLNAFDADAGVRLLPPLGRAWGALGTHLGRMGCGRILESLGNKENRMHPMRSKSGPARNAG